MYAANTNILVTLRTHTNTSDYGCHLHRQLLPKPHIKLYLRELHFADCPITLLIQYSENWWQYWDMKWWNILENCVYIRTSPVANRNLVDAFTWERIGDTASEILSSGWLRVAILTPRDSITQSETQTQRDTHRNREIHINTHTQRNHLTQTHKDSREIQTQTTYSMGTIYRGIFLSDQL